MFTPYCGFESGPLHVNNIYYALAKVCINVKKVQNTAKFRRSLITSMFNVNMLLLLLLIIINDFSECHFVLSFFKNPIFIYLQVLTLPISGPIFNLASNSFPKNQILSHMELVICTFLIIFLEAVWV